LKSRNFKWAGVDIEKVMRRLLKGAADEEEAEEFSEIISHMKEKEIWN
jgi:ferritin-like protein